MMPPFPALPLSAPLAYIGPGAGFAVMGSFLIFVAALALGLLTLLTLPIRLLATLFRRAPKGRFRRVVIVGFDGMDPRRAARLMDAGRLPALASLRANGTFATLGSSCPPMSPVAWSTFSTGVNPGKHGIYDFLSRDLRTCLPELSSARLATDARGRAHAVALRKSRPFWALLGDHGIFSTILRVPITFPAEPFHGLCLSAMCAPDIRGTQGEFTLFTSLPGHTPSAASDPEMTGGLRVAVTPVARGRHRRVTARLPGPTLKGRTCSLGLRVDWRAGVPGRARLRIGGRRLTLATGVSSPWIRLTFRQGLTRVQAIARVLLVATEPGFILYFTPLNIDPGHPALPIAWPSAFSVYLARRHGPFATLGLAEDTWALTDGAISETAFLEQAHAIHREREAMFLDALRLTRRGLCACVFDLTDRVQHTFMRGDKPKAHHEEHEAHEVPPRILLRVLRGENPAPHHKAHEAHEVPPGILLRVLRALRGEKSSTYTNIIDPIDDAYARCDAVIARLLPRLGPRDLLLVLSDHGFTTFERGINVNAWLRDEGYLVEKTPGAATEYLRNVDWSRTRAYSFGLTGIYLNLRGREAGGIVAPGAEAETLKAEIAAKLAALADPARGGAPVARRIYDAARIYHGPYTGRAPDLVCGWRSGYRHSWETAVGRTDGPVLADNPSHWCGDHCVDRDEVPGVLFSNRRLGLPPRGAHLLDFAPTLLSLWNLPQPKHLDGRTWEVDCGSRFHHEEHEDHEGEKFGELRALRAFRGEHPTFNHEDHEGHEDGVR